MSHKCPSADNLPSSSSVDPVISSSNNKGKLSHKILLATEAKTFVIRQTKRGCKYRNIPVLFTIIDGILVDKDVMGEF